MAFTGSEWPKTGPFAVQVIQGRWFFVFACALIMSVAGATYMFGLYSSQIKSSLGYDQSTLNLLSFFKDVGTNVGILSGLLNEVFPPWIVLSMGAVLNLFGYLMVWLAVTKKIPRPQVWHMCVYIYIGANSQSFANTGALVTAVQNFPESRGVVLGLLKGFLGLSGAIITQIYHAVYGNDLRSLILMIGWLPTAVNFVVMRAVRIIEIVRVSNEVKVFYRILYASLGLAGFLMVVIIIQNQMTFTRAAFGVSASIAVILLFSSIGIVVKEELDIWRRKKQELDGISELKVVTEKPEPAVVAAPAAVAAVAASPLPPPPSASVQSSENKEKEISCWNVKSIFNPPPRGDDYTILQALFSMDMLLIFIANLTGIGGCLTAVDNLGQIGGSLGYPKKSISTFVTLVSIWNYLGRVVAGFLSEHLMEKYKFPRTMMLTLTLVISCIGHLLIAFNVPNGLYVASVIIGFCFGAQWPLLYAIISELFGLKYYSTLYNFGASASPAGLYVLNVVVAGSLYDKEAERQLRALGRVRKPGEELNCTGAACFRLSFLIITAATAFGAIVSFYLVMRTREFYKSDIYKKFRQDKVKSTAEAEADNRVAHMSK